MDSSINLISIYASNFIGLLMMLMILGNKSWKIKGRGLESKMLLAMVITIIIMCIDDPIVFTCDGKPGGLAFCGVYIGNAMLYLADAIVAPIWLLLLTYHLCGEISKKRKIYVGLLCLIAALLMVINIFYPLVFTVDEFNVYHRESFFIFYIILEYMTIFDAIGVYISARKKGGALKLFPVLQFIIPFLIGTAVQGVFYGVSTIWPSAGISVCGVLLGLQKEALFYDGLTGMYNRGYLEQLKRRRSTKEGKYTMILMNMSKFRSINNEFGHEEGDRALIATADMLERTVGDLGIVLRYAGDEFMILLNSLDESQINKMVERLRTGLEEYNTISGKGYKLKASIGVTAVDFKRQSVDEMLCALEQKMEDGDEC